MIIFLHGDDTYRSRAKLRELKEKFLREVDPSGANLTIIDGVTANASDIWGAIAAQSFLVRKRMVVVEDIGAQKSNAAREEVAAFLDRIPEDVIVVFWESKSRQPTAPTLRSGSRHEVVGTDSRKQSTKRSTSAKSRRGGATPPPAKNDPLFDRLLAEKYAQEFTPLIGAELGAWIRERAKGLGVTVEPKAQQMLIQEVGSDLWRMANELEKLAIAAVGQPTPSSSPAQGEGEKNNFPTSNTEGGRGVPRSLGEGGGGVGVITPDLVGTLVSETPSDTIFAFIDAVASGDRAGAFRHLRALEAAGAEPQIIAFKLAGQFRLRLTAADLLARGTPIAELAADLGVKPFVAQKVAQQVRGADMRTLRAQLLRLVALDRELKSSRAPWQVLIDLFCFDVTMG